MNSFATNYLSDLNEEQRRAVQHTEGPLLIIAGAGAGKTKTLTYRILHLIKNGVRPNEILAITFTNKAAKEMRERVIDLLKKESSDTNSDLYKPSYQTWQEQQANWPLMCTFHSLAVYILKESGNQIGISRNFSIYDRGDSKQAVKDAIVDSGHDPKQIEPGKILSAISREKGNFVSQEEYEAKNGDDYMGGIIAEVWRRYDATLAKEKALDFDDLLFKATHLLATNAQVRAYYQEKWKYIHIDEYQDTNQVQYRMAKMLAEKHQNIAVVGDGDQSVYSWRGANIKNILNFEEDYKDAKTILLEQNYRSTQTILTAANRVIEKNIYRKKKNLFTRNAEGEKITIYTAYDEADESNFVVNTIRDILKKDRDAEIAVLFRANFQSRVLEEAFLRKDIAYTLLGTKFFERKEVKDTLAYIRASLNNDSLADIKRVINTPARGIGKTTMLKVLEGNLNDLTLSARTKVEEFYRLLARIKNKIETEKASDVVKYVISSSGIEQFYKQSDSDDQIENIKELVTLATKYDVLPIGEGIEKMLEEASLASDQDELDKARERREQNKDDGSMSGGWGDANAKNADNNSNSAHSAEKKPVRLMTVHASKGLEFDYVFITGLEEGLFPHSRQEESKAPEDSEEERRLFYVALTRAKKKLYLSHANVRTIFGSKQVTLPSEFITDVDEDLIEKSEPVTGIKSIFIDF